MKKLSYTLSYIKQDIYTFLLCLIRLSCSHSYNSLRHTSLGFSTSSLTLRQRAQPFLSGRSPFFRALHLGTLILLYPACHPSLGLAPAQSPTGKELNPSSQGDALFSGS